MGQGQTGFLLQLPPPSPTRLQILTSTGASVTDILLIWQGKQCCSLLLFVLL